MTHLSWRLLPLCSKGITGPGLASEEVPFAHSGDLQQRITSKLAAIQHFQRRSRHLARAYLRLRRQHVHSKAGRALRIGLNRSYRRQAQMVEEVQR